MALIGTIAIAMTTNTEGFKKGLDGAQSQMDAFNKKLNKFKNLIMGSFAVALGGAGVAALGHFAGLADDLSDNIERLEVMFGSASDSIVAQAEKMNQAFGTSEITFTAMATKMGGLFKAMGVENGPAAQMTNQLLTLGQAIANFKGISLEEAMGKVQAGMMGRGKGLKEFGIDVKATMSVQERFNALMSGGAGIIGAMGQRAMDAGASWAEFRGRIEQVEIALGKNLPELVEPFFKELNVSLVAAINWFKGLNNETLNWGEQTLSSAKGAAEGMGWVQTAIGGVADAWQQMSLGFHDFRSGLNEAIAQLLGALGKVGDAFDWIADKLGMVDKVKPAFGTGDMIRIWGDTLHETAKKEYEEFQKEMGKPLASEGIAAAYKAAHEKIEAARHEVQKTAVDAVSPPSKNIVKDVAKSAGAALAAGGMGTASVITKGKYGIGDEGHKKKMEKLAEEQLKATNRINANLEAGNDPEMMDDF